MADGCDRSKQAVTQGSVGDSTDENELERLAIESILLEAKRGKLRAESFGPSGWQRCRIPRTNKRFLNALVSDAVATNKRMRIQQLRREQLKVDNQTDNNGQTDKPKVDDQTDLHDTPSGQTDSYRALELEKSPREDMISGHDIHRLNDGSLPVKSSEGNGDSDHN